MPIETEAIQVPAFGCSSLCRLEPAAVAPRRNATTAKLGTCRERGILASCSAVALLVPVRLIAKSTLPRDANDGTLRLPVVDPAYVDMDEI
jgi:hypothetical protein